MRRRSDAGETLVEVVIAIVIVSLAVTALIASLATAAASAKSHRDNVLTDSVMRNYAEATKRAAETCTSGGTFNVVYSPPSGFSVSTSPGGGSCPTIATTLTLNLSVVGPAGISKSMQLKVRTP